MLACNKKRQYLMTTTRARLAKSFDLQWQLEAQDFGQLCSFPFVWFT
jgi:hypothetical protein